MLMNDEYSHQARSLISVMCLNESSRRGASCAGQAALRASWLSPDWQLWTAQLTPAATISALLCAY